MSKWRLATKSKPKDNQVVLVTHNLNDELEVECVRYLNGEWEQADYGEWSIDEQYIIAWQPLPKPYETK